MSKAVANKVAQPQPSVASQENPVRHPLAIREVSALSNIPDSKNEIVTAYKDLNAESVQMVKARQQHLMIAFAAFILLGLGILMGSRFSPSRSVASSFKGFEVEGTPTHTEHYQYDKTCYKGENGEQVCMTRTSRK